jgi:hypothetical protein
MTESMLVGARGWDYPGWHGGFYPEELPEDWRLTYYNNLLRAVLVPGEAWSSATADTVRGWAEDTDASFRFVVETPAAFADPAGVTAARVADFHALLAPLGDRMAGVLWRVAPGAAVTSDALSTALPLLGGHQALCIELPGPSPAPQILACLAQHGAGLCWRPEAMPAPVPAGRLIVTLGDEVQPRAQRVWLEKLAAATAGDRQGALFLATAEQATQARLIAELMGV